jgi:hypothetical protein
MRQSVWLRHCLRSVIALLVVLTCTAVHASALQVLGTRLVRESDFDSTKGWTGGVLQIYLYNPDTVAASVSDFAIDGVSRANLPTTAIPGWKGTGVGDSRWWQCWPQSIPAGGLATLRIRLADVPTTLGSDGTGHTLRLYYSDSTNQDISFTTPAATPLWLPFVAFSDDLYSMTIYAANRGSSTILLDTQSGVLVNNTAVAYTMPTDTLEPGDILPITVTFSTPLTEGALCVIEVVPITTSDPAWGSLRVLKSSFGVTFWQQGSGYDAANLAQHHIDTTIPGAGVFLDEPRNAKQQPQTVADNVMASWNSYPASPVMCQFTEDVENRIWGDIPDITMTHHGNWEQDMSVFMSWPKPIWYLPQNAWGRKEGVGGHEGWCRLEDLLRESWRSIGHGAKDIQWFTYFNLWSQGYTRGGGYDIARKMQDFFMPGAIANPVLWDRVGRVSGVLQLAKSYLLNSMTATGWRMVSDGVEINTLVAKDSQSAVIVLNEEADFFFKEGYPTTSETVRTNLQITARIPTYLSPSVTNAYLLNPFSGVQAVPASFNRTAGTVTLTVPELRGAALIVLGSSSDGTALNDGWTTVSAPFADYGDLSASTESVPAAQVIPAEWIQIIGNAPWSVESLSDGSKLLVTSGKKVFLLNSDGTKIWEKLFPGRVFHARFSTNQDRIYVAADLTDNAPAAYNNAHILCYDFSGVEQWRHKVGDIAAITDDGLKGRIVFDMKTGCSDNGVLYCEWNGYAVRLNSNGGVVWTSKYDMYTYDVEALSDGSALALSTMRTRRISATGAINYHRSEASSTMVDCAISPTEERIAFAGNHLNIYLNNTLVASPYVGRNIRVIKFSPDGTKIAAGTCDGVFTLFDANGNALFTDTDKATYVTDIQFLPNNAGVAVMREHFGYAVDTMWRFRDSVEAFTYSGTSLWRHEGRWRAQPHMGSFVVSSTNNRLFVATGEELRLVDLTASPVDNDYLYDFQPVSLPSGWANADIGNPVERGSARFSNLDDSITQQGGGEMIGGTADQCNYTYRTLTGDGSIVVRIPSASTPDSYSEAGVMIRETLDAGAKEFCAVYVPRQPNNHGIRYRSTTGGNTTTISGSYVIGPIWLKITRAGNVFAAYQSTDGMNWTQISTTAPTIAMASTVYIGTVVCSHSVVQPDVPGVGIMEAVFDHVSVNDTAVTMGVNRPPTVNAGNDQTVEGGAVLDATITDDGLPNGTVFYQWSKVSGPGTVTFGNPATDDTTAVFSATGTYVLRLTVFDGLLVDMDEVQITVTNLLLQNTGMELDDDSNNYPDFWGARATGSRASDAVHAGSYALKAVGPASFTYSAQTCNLTPGASYTLTAWVKAEKTAGATIWAQVRYVQLTPTTVIYLSNAIAVTSDWSPIVRNFTVPADHVGGRLDLVWEIPGAGDVVWFDDVTLVPGTVTLPIPAAPSSLAATAVSSSQINLSWIDNSDNENGFKIERAPDNSGTPGTFTQIGYVGAGVTTYQDSGLSASTIYHYRVRAYNASGHSSYTETMYATTYGPNLLQNPGMELDSDSNNYPDSWGARATGSRASDAVHSGSYALKAVGPATFTYSPQTCNLTPGASYILTAWVKANKSAGATINGYMRYAQLSPSTVIYETTRVQATSDWTQVTRSFTVPANHVGGRVDICWDIPGTGDIVWFDDVSLVQTTTSPPASPSNLAATPVSGSMIALTWSDNSSTENGYKIERAPDSGGTPGTFTQIDTVGADVTLYEDTGLSSTTTYHYRVRAYNTGGDSGYSNTTSAATTPPTLVLNPGMELDLNGDNYPDYWAQRTTGSRVSDAVHSGSYALKAVGPATLTYSAQTCNLTPGASYTLTAWVKADKTAGATINGYVRYAQLTPSTVIYETTRVQATADWTQVIRNFTVPTDHVGGRLDLMWEIPGTGDAVWFDDISLTQN